MGVNIPGILIGWMARMTSVKNPNLLLKVASQLPHVNFVMAGGGDLLEEVSVDAPANVRVIGWTDAAIFWSAVDIAISTSNNEGMPIALIEAQLAGLPVIATDVGSISEVIREDVTGLVTNKTAEAVVTAINQLILNSNLIRNFGVKGREQASQNFNLKKMIRTHEDLYRNL